MITFFSHFWTIFLVIFFFASSILIHEFGHYIVAKSRGMYVPQFSIGFGPKLIGWKFRGTEFIISLLPLGGYVALPQLADLKEVEGTFELPKGLKNATFSDKVLSAFAGPFFNLLFAFGLAVILMMIGLPTPQEELTTTIGYISNETASSSPSLRIGDKILSVDGTKVHKFSDIQQLIAMGTHQTPDGQAQSTLEIERDGNILSVSVFPSLKSWSNAADDQFRTLEVYPEQNLVISGFSKIFPANQAVAVGDRLVAINQLPLRHLQTLHDQVNLGGTAQLTIEHHQELLSLDIPIQKVPTKSPYMAIQTSLRTPIYIVPTQNGNFGVIHHARLFSREGIKENTPLLAINDRPIEQIFQENGASLLGADHLKLGFQTPSGERSILVPSVQNITFHEGIFQNRIGLKFSRELQQVHLNPLAQIYNITAMTFKTLYSLFSPSSSISPKHLMGPAGLLTTLHAHAQAHFTYLLWFVILINVNLAIFNLLPLPVLDGGIITIATIERLTGWRHLEKFFSKLQGLCFALLLALILYVTFFDVKRIWAQHAARLEEKLLQTITLPLE